MFFFYAAQTFPVNTTENGLRPGGDWASGVASKDTDFFVMPAAGDLKNLFVRARTTGAGAGTVTGKVWVNPAPSFGGWIDTGIGISVSQNSNLESEDTTNTYAVQVGDRVAITLQNSVAGTTLWEEPSATIELIE